jgi:hypothetical protein
LIHTPNDTMEYFEPAGLERSGGLILELVTKFDRGQPEERGTTCWFLPAKSRFLCRCYGSRF